MYYNITIIHNAIKMFTEYRIQTGVIEGKDIRRMDKVKCIMIAIIHRAAV